MVPAEGLFPVSAGKGPRKPYSSSAHYQEILDLNGEVEVMGHYAMFFF
jgi:hypothetical protein